jgi:tetratricopeptide (TPR) repeat protein
MSQDKPPKTPPKTPRVPSTVPNDLDHLDVPGALNIPLHERRRRPQARRRGRLPGWAKALLAVGGAVAAFGIVALAIFLIAFPSFFRSLEPRYQERIIEVMPAGPLREFVADFKPTVPFKVLPTLSGAGNSDAAQQLLLTQDTTPTPTTDAAQALPSPTATSEGIPAGMVPTETPTLLPDYASPTPPQAGPTWTPVAITTEIPLPSQYKLGNIKYEAQSWNNCGPTTMTMALSYYGWTDNQYTAAKWMKPNTEDKNVSPWQMVRFVQENTGVKALYRMGGTVQLLKRLLSANFPVGVEEGLEPAGEEWMGHYLLLIGYDDVSQNFLTFDSYLGSNQGQGRPYSYTTFDDYWRNFNRVFIVIYEQSRELELRHALGDYVDPAYAYKVALETARDEATRNSQDKWAWFNMGTSYVGLGEYENAAAAFDQATKLQLPWRMLWYQFGPYEAYFQMGRYDDVLSLAQINRTITPYVEETYYWQGMVFAAQGRTGDAIDRFDEALHYNKNFFPAQEAKAQVEAGTFQVASTNG